MVQQGGCTKPQDDIYEMFKDIKNNYSEEKMEWKTKHPQCIGCGKFLRKDRNWNQCSDCDTREPEEIGRY